MRAVEGQEQAVHDLLLSNRERIWSGEQGNLAFAVSRSRTDPREFWLYETWVDEDSVARHESYVTTRYLRCVAAGDSTTLNGSSFGGSDRS
jgi:quinol monooxygenase YgiN